MLDEKGGSLNWGEDRLRRCPESEFFDLEAHPSELVTLRRGKTRSTPKRRLVLSICVLCTRLSGLEIERPFIPRVGRATGKVQIYCRGRCDPLTRAHEEFEAK